MKYVQDGGYKGVFNVKCVLFVDQLQEPQNSNANFYSENSVLY